MDMSSTKAGEKLSMPRPPGMSAERSFKAEIYAYSLYMHGAATLEQLVGLTQSSDTTVTVRDILRDSQYAKSQTFTGALYRDGVWRKSNRLQAWRLTTDGMWRVEKYLLKSGTESWGYSSGHIVRNVSGNVYRYLLLSDWIARLRTSGSTIDWFDVAYWLDSVEIRTDESIRKLWKERPRMAGAIEVDFGGWIGVGIMQKSLRTAHLSVNRMFPQELNQWDKVKQNVLLTLQEHYESRYVPLDKLAYQRPDLLVLPYEFTHDHPDSTVLVLRGKREEALRPLIEGYEKAGWSVERTNQVPELMGTEFYTYRAKRDGQVEFFDSTFGTSLAQVYSLFNHERFTVHGVAPGRRVVYVTSEGEEQGIRAFLKKQVGEKLNGYSTEFRLLEL